MRGDKQDNMVETEDFTDPQHGIPVFSLYGEVRRPTASRWARSMSCSSTSRISAAHLHLHHHASYVLEAAAQHKKAVWVLDRPNPAGRPIEGTTLLPGLGELRRRRADPDAPRPHSGRTRPLVRRSFQARCRLPGHRNGGLSARGAPGFGWPLDERIWINPSPNAANLWMARAYAGTVMLEGHDAVGGGGGTSRPLELFGLPDIGRPRR
jgi:uncharacterized protein YbbC (DUF1343 family)